MLIYSSMSFSCVLSQGWALRRPCTVYYQYIISSTNKSASLIVIDLFMHTTLVAALSLSFFLFPVVRGFPFISFTLFPEIIRYFLGFKSVVLSFLLTFTHSDKHSHYGVCMCVNAFTAQRLCQPLDRLKSN